MDPNDQDFWTGAASGNSGAVWTRRVKFGVQVIGVVILTLALVLLSTLALDVFEWLTAGSLLENVLNWASRAYLWIGLVAAMIIGIGFMAVNGSKKPH